MRLYVVRHGVAEEATAPGGDRARRLTPRGRTRMRRAARGLRRLGVRVETLLTSPLPRAAETAAILAADGRLPKPRTLDALAPETPPLEMLAALRRLGGRGDYMLVGHEPGLSGLVAVLLAGSPEAMAVELKKGACVALELDRLVPRGATLVWLAPTRLLRRLGRRRRQWGSPPAGA